MEIHSDINKNLPDSLNNSGSERLTSHEFLVGFLPPIGGDAHSESFISSFEECAINDPESTNNLQNEKLQRRRGRPKTGFDQNEYNKKHGKENTKKFRQKLIEEKGEEYLKEYDKKYRQKVFQEKGEQYDKLIYNVKKYNKLSRYSFKLIKEIKDDPELPEKFKILINKMLDSEI